MTFSVTSRGSRTISGVALFLVDAAIFREWMVGIGRRLAFSRIAHLFCELIVRMQAVGLCSEYTIELPLTQSDTADAVGISTVHVNRTLQELRRKGLIKFAGGTLTAMDWPRLCVAGQFDETYLHQNLLMTTNDRFGSTAAVTGKSVIGPVLLDEQT
jgi:Crp-like helix-turn-helix domain